MTPVVVEEIEFYVSKDGKEVGISISGLARLCGVSQQAISGILKEVESVTSSERIKSLKLTADKLFLLQLGEKNAKVLSSAVATRLIKYYAYESKYATETAKYSLDKFLELGFDNWVKVITGFDVPKENPNDMLTKLYSEFRELNAKTTKLTSETEELRKLRQKTKDSYKGLDKLIDDLVKEESNLLPPEDSNNRNYTITEWLRECKGILDIDLTLRSKLSIMASQNYKTLKGVDPEKGIRKHSNGKINNGVTVYYEEDLPILELAFNRLFIKK